MSRGRNRHSAPFWKDNKSGLYIPTPQPVDAPKYVTVPHVEATRDIKIGDKTISFVADALDCCIEKVVKEYVPYFQQEEYQVTVTLQKGMKEIIKLIPRWVVLVRVGSGKSFPQDIGLDATLKLVQHLRKLGIRVVYYIDDFLVMSNGKAPITIASICDAVIVATSELKDFFNHLRDFRPPVIHVPTHVDIPMFDIMPPLDYIRNMPRYKVLVTSSGRVGATGLYEICEKANDIPEFDDIQLIINSSSVAQMRTLINSFRHLHKTYLDSMPLNEYYGLCKSVNVILNPASPNDLDYLVPTAVQPLWLNSKSALKYTMAGAARIPVISSPIRSYKEAIKDGETGFITNSANEFIEKILYLKNNPAQAARMGIAARQDIMANYDIRKRYSLYRDAIIGDYKGDTAKPELAPARAGASTKKLFIPAVDGGPGSFYANMRKYAPIISDGRWTITNNIKIADVAIAVAFLYASQIFAEMESRGLKYIYRLDGLPTDFDGNLHPDHLKIMQELFRHASSFVWQSKHCQDMWLNKGLVPVEVDCFGPIIPNGVDTSIFKPLDYKKEDDGKIHILHTNWSTFPHKRLDLLEKVIQEALTSAPNLVFHLLGNYVSTDVMANTERWKNYSNVIYLGQITDRNKESLDRLVLLYQAADAFLFTSEMEGSPNTLLEAIACGLPIIFNANSNIVPEICGNACIGFTNEQEFIQQYPNIIGAVIPTLDEKYTMPYCAKQYVAIATALAEVA